MTKRTKLPRAPVKVLDKPIEGERIKCKCGRILILNHSTLTTYHEAPLCKTYRDALKTLGGNKFDGIVSEPKE